MFVATPEDLGVRLDKILSQQFPTHSRSYFQMLIEEDYVLVNGHPVKKQHKLNEGDKIEVFFQDPPLLDVVPEDLPLDILYEDEDILVINKEAGMVVHPGAGVSSKTFANALLYHCQSIAKKDFDPFRPGIVHRLDKGTTGILIAAKTKKAHQNLVDQFSTRRVEKKYLAVCCGIPPEGKYSAPIKRHPIRRKEMTISLDGREASSQFTVLNHKEGLSLVEVDLLTGRTHQIRVHLKSLHCPILGDPLYGNDRCNKKYNHFTQLLHAHQLRCMHPISNKPLEFTGPVPRAMKDFIEFIQQA